MFRRVNQFGISIKPINYQLISYIYIDSQEIDRALYNSLHMILIVLWTGIIGPAQDLLSGFKLGVMLG